MCNGIWRVHLHFPFLLVVLVLVVKRYRHSSCVTPGKRTHLRFLFHWQVVLSHLTSRMSHLLELRAVDGAEALPVQRVLLLRLIAYIALAYFGLSAMTMTFGRRIVFRMILLLISG